MTIAQAAQALTEAIAEVDQINEHDAQILGRVLYAMDMVCSREWILACLKQIDMVPADRIHPTQEIHVEIERGNASPDRPA